jgi:nickel transport protein
VSTAARVADGEEDSGDVVGGGGVLDGDGGDGDGDGDAASSTPGPLRLATPDAVDAAVARQLRPLLEAYEAAEGRTRFNDIMGGIGMIMGLAGLALWGSTRRAGGKA